MATPQPVQDIEIRELEDLKAGQCNDNLRFNEFQALLRDVYPAHLNLVEDRIVIRVEREDGSPVHGAVIAVEEEQQVPTIRTGSDGKAYLFPGLLGMSSQRPIQMEVRCPEAVWGQSDADGRPAEARYGDEITVEMPCEPVEEVLLDVVYLHDVTGSTGDEMAQLQFTTERVMDMLEDEYGQ